MKALTTTVELLFIGLRDGKRAQDFLVVKNASYGVR